MLAYIPINADTRILLVHSLSEQNQGTEQEERKRSHCPGVLFWKALVNFSFAANLTKLLCQKMR